MMMQMRQMRGGATRLARTVGLARDALAFGLLAVACQFAPQALADGPDGAPPIIAAPEMPGRTNPNAAHRLRSAGVTPGINLLGGDNSLPPLDEFNPPTLPVVVELFTSQGCSSCPPADAMMARLAAEPGVLPLSFHVDYWDYLGWTDSFAKPDFTRRQEAYARAAGEHALYTPQLIVDGEDTAVGPGPAQLKALIDAHRISPALVSVQSDSSPEGTEIRLLPLSDLGGEVAITLIRYAPSRTVEVASGENRGRQITYTNVVLSLQELADWDGVAPLKLTVSKEGPADDSFPADTRHLLLIQKELPRGDLPGAILAAIRLD